MKIKILNTKQRYMIEVHVLRFLKRIPAQLIFLSLFLGDLYPVPVAAYSGQYVGRAHLNAIDENSVNFVGGLKEFNFDGIEPIRLPGWINGLDEDVAVIIEMKGDPLARLASNERGAGSPLSSGMQRAYSQTLLDAQAPVAAQVIANGGLVIDQYSKVYNGMLVHIPLSGLGSIRSLPEVKAIHLAPIHTPSLLATVPHIRADRVVEDLGITGDGIRVAVIDTGADYEHAALGGSGDPNDYLTNDPKIIEPEHPFPNAKVIGGYDFAGSDYTGENTPVPDPDPLDEYEGDGHGTHVSSTVAGLPVPPKIGHGIAPEALLYAVKVFGKSGSSDLMISGIEWAVDPNGDGDLSDRADVINLSLGGEMDKDDPNDPEIVAVDSAVMAGAVVVAAAGNFGYADGDRNNAYEIGSPAVAASAIGVAASTNGSVPAPTLDVVDASPPPTQTNIAYFTLFGSHIPTFTVDLEAPIFDVSRITTDTLCTIPPELVGQKPFANNVALLQDGMKDDCTNDTQANNAAELGAVAALIYNEEYRWKGIRDWRNIEEVVNIPVGLLVRQDGLNLLPSHLKTVRIHPQNTIQIVGDSEFRLDDAAFFTSRGPAGLSSLLKPDVSAPGVNIYAAYRGAGTNGTYDTGTSMASPVVAGVAALVRQAHPYWAPEQVKAALMNTAVPMPDPASAVFSISGAGRVDALAAVQADVLGFGKPRQAALSLGRIPITEADYRDQGIVTLQNTAGLARTYDVSWNFAGLSFTQGFTLTLTDAQVILPAAPSLASLGWRLQIDGSMLFHTVDVLPEYYGYIVFTNHEDSNDILRIPFYAVVQAETRLNIGTPTLTHVRGEAQISHSGPIDSQPEIFPLLYSAPRNPDVPPSTNLRYCGLTVRNDPQYGPALRLALTVHGAWNTYWRDHDGDWKMELSLKQDGSVDYINDIWDEGLTPIIGFPPGQHRKILVKDGEDHIIGFSPLPQAFDYNSGWMILETPLSMNGLDLGSHSRFAFRVVETNPKTDEETRTDWIRIDLARLPLSWSLSATPGPSNPSTTIHFAVADPTGYTYANPLGLLVLDPTGASGVGQAYPLLFKFDQPFVNFFSFVSRSE